MLLDLSRDSGNLHRRTVALMHPDSSNVVVQMQRSACKWLLFEDVQ